MCVARFSGRKLRSVEQSHFGDAFRRALMKMHPRMVFQRPGRAK